MDNKEKKELIKINSFGPPNSGKFAIFNRYINDSFHEYYNWGGRDIMFKDITINDKQLSLMFFSFKKINKPYQSLDLKPFFRNSDAVLLVFDLSYPKNYSNLDFWLNEIETKAPEDALVFLIGNKCELLEREVEESYIDEFVQKHNNRICKYFEVSARNNINIKETFDFIIRKILSEKENHPEKRRYINITPTLENKDNKKKIKNKDKCYGK